MQVLEARSTLFRLVPSGHAANPARTVAKMELGVGTPVFVKDYRRYGTLATLSWTQHTWQWLHSKGLISIDDQASMGELPLRRKRRLEQRNLVAVHRCRLYYTYQWCSDDRRYLQWVGCGGQVNDRSCLARPSRHTYRSHYYE
jgi:hypothetical protein